MSKQQKFTFVASYHRKGKKHEVDKAKDGHGMRFDTFTVWAVEEKEARLSLLSSLINQKYRVVSIERGELHA